MGIYIEAVRPETDPRIAVNFSPRDMTGKDEGYAVLQRMLGLRQEPHTPINGNCQPLGVPQGAGLDLRSASLIMMELPHTKLWFWGKGRPEV